MMKIRDMLATWLWQRGFDGLCGENCGCGTDNLAPCGKCLCDCEPAYCDQAAGNWFCAASDSDCLIDPTAELQTLFDLQRKQMTEAIALWRKATGEQNVTPDLGELLKWLCEKIYELKNTNLRLTEEDEGLRRSYGLHVSVASARILALEAENIRLSEQAEGLSVNYARYVNEASSKIALQNKSALAGRERIAELENAYIRLSEQHESYVNEASSRIAELEAEVARLKEKSND